MRLSVLAFWLPQLCSNFVARFTHHPLLNAECRGHPVPRPPGRYQVQTAEPKNLLVVHRNDVCPCVPREVCCYENVPRGTPVTAPLFGRS